MRRLTPLLLLPFCLMLLSGCARSVQAAALNLEALDSLPSYHTTVNEVVKDADSGQSVHLHFENDYVAPDRARSTVAVSIGGTTVAVDTIAVGQRVWGRQDGPWQEIPSPPIDRTAAAAADKQLFAAFTTLPGKGTQLNGQDVTRYSSKGVSTQDIDTAFADELDLTKPAFTSYSAGLGQALSDLSLHVTSANFWAANNGSVPVKVVLKIDGQTSGHHIVVSLTVNWQDIGSSAITIEPPV
jgi:hypothetical protein